MDPLSIGLYVDQIVNTTYNVENQESNKNDKLCGGTTAQIKKKKYQQETFSYNSFDHFYNNHDNHETETTDTCEVSCYSLLKTNYCYCLLEKLLLSFLILIAIIFLLNNKCCNNFDRRTVKRLIDRISKTPRQYNPAPSKIATI